jgi:chromosome segregation ATPase
LLDTWGYIIWDKNSIKETIQHKDTISATTSGQRDILQRELEDATMSYDMIRTSNSMKDSTITAKDHEFDMKKARIESLLSKIKATEAELKEARALIGELNGDIEGYKNHVELLQGQKIQLVQEKVGVTQQRDKIQKAFDSSVKVIRDQESIIEVGSTLHASNFNIIGLQDKAKGKEKETTNAKKVDKLRITFDLDEKLITATGTKELYILITATDGKTIAHDEVGLRPFHHT